MKYIISDTHFNHEHLLCNLPNPRPSDYSSRIFKQLTSLTESDILYHLGDICIGKDKEMHEKYIMPLKCKKILIRGNHDKKSDNWYLNHGWDVVCDEMKFTYQAQRYVLTHQPIDNTDIINIHGHLHNRFDIERLDGLHLLYAAERENYMPVTIDNLVKKDRQRRNNNNHT